MKTIYKIVGYYDRGELKSPVFVKTTYSKQFVKERRWERLKKFQNLDSHGCIHHVKVFARERPAYESKEAYKAECKERTRKLQHEYHEILQTWAHAPFVRYIWKEVPISIFGKVKEI